MPITTTVSQAGRWDVFVPYSGLHLLSVAACFAMIAALVLLGRRLSATTEPRLRWAMALFAFMVWGAYNIAWNWKGIEEVELDVGSDELSEEPIKRERICKGANE